MFEWFANVLRNGCLIRQHAIDKTAQGVLKGQRNITPRVNERPVKVTQDGRN
jgi:hypothetical protein